MACGLDHSLFLLQNGEVWGCGWAADGQTGQIGRSNRLNTLKLEHSAGTGSYESTAQPHQVDLGSEKAVLLASCSDSSFALTGQFLWL